MVESRIPVEPFLGGDRASVSRKGGRCTVSPVLQKLTVPVPNRPVTDTELCGHFLKRPVLHHDRTQCFIPPMDRLVGLKKKVPMVTSVHARLLAKCHRISNCGSEIVPRKTKTCQPQLEEIRLKSWKPPTDLPAPPPTRPHRNPALPQKNDDTSQAKKRESLNKSQVPHPPMSSNSHLRKSALNSRSQEMHIDCCPPTELTGIYDRH